MRLCFFSELTLFTSPPSHHDKKKKKDKKRKAVSERGSDRVVGVVMSAVTPLVGQVELLSARSSKLFGQTLWKRVSSASLSLSLCPFCSVQCWRGGVAVCYRQFPLDPSPLCSDLFKSVRASPLRVLWPVTASVVQQKQRAGLFFFYKLSNCKSSLCKH